MSIGSTTDPRVLVVMGVSGSGKTTVAALLAGRTGWAFAEGDSLHPPSNVAKMRAGHPLTDEDRLPWLQKVATWIGDQLDAGNSGVVSCSALKRRYRDILNGRGHGVVFVYLCGDKETIDTRLTARHGHFMSRSLLESQFATLEEPQPDEPAIRVNIGAPPEEVVQTILETLKLNASATGEGS